MSGETGGADVLRAALSLAAVRLEILTDRMRACHEETGKHELLAEAEMFCQEARAALDGVGSASRAPHNLAQEQFDALVRDAMQWRALSPAPSEEAPGPWRIERHDAAADGLPSFWVVRWRHRSFTALTQDEAVVVCGALNQLYARRAASRVDASPAPSEEALLRAARPVLEFVSRGREHVRLFWHEAPDATARRVLGAIDRVVASPDTQEGK